MTKSLCAVSVDLDEIRFYRQIHGLAEGAGEHSVYDVALRRMARFARERRLPLTLFAVGEDLDRPESARALAEVVGQGHVVENHSLHHRYDLSRLTVAEIAAEIEGGARAIERVTGRCPVGFRAPGYAMSEAVFDVLEEMKVAFDSSVFPCPAYWGAKAAVLASMRARGRTSASIVDSPRVLAAPTGPYRPGRPFHRRGKRRLVELPIQVTPGLHLPVIGTSIALAGPTGARWLARACSREPLVNLELHGIDFLDVTDGLGALAGHQPELRASLPSRLRALDAFLEPLARSGRQFVTLADAAQATC